MSTQTKKSPDNTHKLNRRAICLRAPLALIILLTIFLAPQRSASTQALQDPPGRDKMQTEMIGGHEVEAGAVIARFNRDIDEDQLRTFVANAIAMVNASDHREIASGLNMFHIRSNMNTQALLNILSKVPGLEYA